MNDNQSRYGHRGVVRRPEPKPESSLRFEHVNPDGTASIYYTRPDVPTIEI